MKKLYEAENGIEAHMIVNLLEQAQLNARIDGEFLQGGVGEIQTSGIVRVMVAEEDFDASREIIKQWETKQPESDNDEIPKGIKSNFLTNVALLVVGLMSGIGVTYYMNYVPTFYDGMDHNGDGIRDETWVYKNNRMSKAKLDRNFDGEVDHIFYYDRFAFLKKSISDDNFDGVFETNTHFHQGNPDYSEQDMNGDGFYEFQTNYKNGVAQVSHIIDPHSNKIIKSLYFDLSRVTKAEEDTDRDGVLDTVYEYDEIGDLVHSYQKKSNE